jgi:hypothetical protein
MTIFVLHLDPIQLDNLLSIDQIFTMCRHLSKGIYIYLVETLLVDYPQLQRDVIKNFAIIKWYLNKGTKLVSAQANAKLPMHIRYICLEKRVNRIIPTVKTVFSLNTISSVNPRLLLEFMSKLLDDGLKHLNLHLFGEQLRLLTNCRSHLRMALIQLSNAVGNIPLLRGVSLDGVQEPDFVSILIKVEFLDDINVTRYFK